MKGRTEMMIFINYILNYLTVNQYPLRERFEDFYFED